MFWYIFDLKKGVGKFHEQLVHKAALDSLKKGYKCKKCGIRFWDIFCFEKNVGKFHEQLVYKTGLDSS